MTKQFYFLRLCANLRSVCILHTHTYACMKCACAAENNLGSPSSLSSLLRQSLLVVVLCCCPQASGDSPLSPYPPSAGALRLQTHSAVPSFTGFYGFKLRPSLHLQDKHFYIVSYLPNPLCSFVVYIYLLGTDMWLLQHTPGSQRTAQRVSSQLPPCGSQGLNSGFQVWWIQVTRFGGKCL